MAYNGGVLGHFKTIKNQNSIFKKFKCGLRGQNEFEVILVFCLGMHIFKPEVHNKLDEVGRPG